MSGGAIYCNSLKGVFSDGGGVYVADSAVFTMQSGRIQGSTDSDGFAKNILTGRNESWGAALNVDMYEPDTTAKWGAGGAYTTGGASQTGGSVIGSTNDTLIAVPGR